MVFFSRLQNKQLQSAQGRRKCNYKLLITKAFVINWSWADRKTFDIYGSRKRHWLHV